MNKTKWVRPQENAYKPKKHVITSAMTAAWQGSRALATKDPEQPNPTPQSPNQGWARNVPA